MSTLSRLGLGAALLVSLAAPASAQVTVGAKAGLNVASLSGDDADGLDPRLGFAGGLQARYDVTPSFGLQAEVLYSQKGAKESDGSDQGTYALDYIEIPVLARIAVPLTRLGDAGIYAGPSIGIPVSGKFRSDDEGRNDIDYKDNLSTNVGAALGVDYYAGPVGVDLRYTLGLSDVFDGNRGLNDARNQVFTVSLGYRFTGGGRRY